MIGTAKISLTLSVSEFDLMRETLQNRVNVLSDLIRDTSIPSKLRNDARAEYTKLKDFLDKL